MVRMRTYPLDLHVVDAEMHYQTSLADGHPRGIIDNLTGARLLRDLEWRARYAAADEPERQAMRQSLTGRGRPPKSPDDPTKSVRVNVSLTKREVDLLAAQDEPASAIIRRLIVDALG